MKSTLNRHGNSRTGASPTVVALLAVAATSSSVHAQPACEPRSIREPGRLNIAIEVERFGLVPPREARLIFYIARNTDLRQVDGRVRMAGPGNDYPDWFLFSAELIGQSGGLLRAEYPLVPARTSCAYITLQMRVDHCFDGSSKPMECPSIRIVSPPSFEGLSVAARNLDVCVD